MGRLLDLHADSAGSEHEGQLKTQRLRGTTPRSAAEHVLNKDLRCTRVLKRLVQLSDML